MADGINKIFELIADELDGKENAFVLLKDKTELDKTASSGSLVPSAVYIIALAGIYKADTAYSYISIADYSGSGVWAKPDWNV